MAKEVKVGDKIYSFNIFTEAYSILTVTRVAKLYVFAALDKDKAAVEHKINKKHINGYDYGVITPDVEKQIARHKRQNVFFQYLKILQTNFRLVADEDITAIVEIARKYKVGT